ncbi:MAG: terminase small subunit [Elusimicrobia bacterium]|nr:terminase small subunit [Elusimicrobiota bacterium]
MPKPPANKNKRRRFAQEYLIDHNGAQAAIRAGYAPGSARVTASRLLTDANVAAWIAEGERKATARVEVTADVVLGELLKILNSDVRYFEVDDNGVLTLAKDAPEWAWRAVSSVKHKTRTFTRKDGESETIHDVEFRLWDKPAAARMLGEHLALYKQRLGLDAGDGPVEFTLKLSGAKDRGAKD